MTPARVRHDISAQRDIPDSPLPMLAKEPIDRTDANDPMLPMDRADPTDPIDNTDPVHPMHRKESREAMLMLERAGI